METIIETFMNYGADTVSIEASYNVKAHFPCDEEPNRDYITSTLEKEGLVLTDYQSQRVNGWNITSHMNGQLNAKVTPCYSLNQVGILCGIGLFVLGGRKFFRRNNGIPIDYIACSTVISGIGGFLWSINNEDKFEGVSVTPDSKGCDMFGMILTFAIGGFVTSFMYVLGEKLLENLRRDYYNSDDRNYNSKSSIKY